MRREDSWHKAEAGGQLFARLTRSEIVVEKVTGPRTGAAVTITNPTGLRSSARSRVRLRL
jgi:hypothetical protein